MKKVKLRVLQVAALLLLATLPLFALAQDGNILLYGGNQDIDNIDPATGENYSINAALRSLYDALFIYRGNDIEPHLVDSWEVNDDATVWTFKLKDNAVFHDGSPVNAEAVVYSFNRLLEINGPPAYRWATISDENTAQALDEYTVQFTLTEPFAPFIGTLPQLFVVNPAIVEANRGDDYGQAYLKENEAGSGPFTQGRWEIGNVYEFVAVDDYWAGWKGESHLDGFLWIIQRDAATMKNSLLAGETYVADGISGSDIEEIDGTDGFSVEQNVGFFTNTLKMNTQGEYTSDINVRKAIAYAMNYDALPEVQDVGITILPGPTPANFMGYVDGLEVPTYDIEKAKEYLAMSPWPEGGFTLDYVYVTDFPREEVPGLLLLEGLAELNIELNMTPMLWPDMVASCATPETGPDLINIYTLPAYLDPDAHLYNQYHSAQWGSYNSCSFYKNEQVDSLLDEARVLGDMDKRLELYTEAQTLIAADQPSVWMYTEDSSLALNQCVKGYTYSPMYPITMLFQDLWLDGCP
ncbi:MAG: ABC transporter substrate-binding protein [Trueperaceae bacterium]|nr:ABC transporter substrate-binding protein [Trueperaceae bacterium]